jgi:hypothetical protein
VARLQLRGRRTMRDATARSCSKTRTPRSSSSSITSSTRAWS